MVADATFWGRGYGVIVFRCPQTQENLYWQEIRSETIEVYRIGRETLERMGYTIQAVVLDGKRGIRSLFNDIPVQQCQFHQIAAINRYLTRRPKLPAGKELRLLTLSLTIINEKLFTLALEEWHARWESFLKERTINTEIKRWYYTHRRTRSAYRSLKTNLPYLFTCQRHPELHIPNTTNSLDGSFSHIKGLLQIHRGLKRQRRYRLIQEILSK